MKKVFAIIAIILLLPVMTFAAEFWGSKKSNKYHYPNCQWAQKIKPANLVKFSSPEEAKKAGYVPCKVCSPPISSKVEIESDQNILVAGLNPSEEKQGCCS
jgi:methylphosphotriester-DNA--protein-cysteine methyltransferase